MAVIVTSTEMLLGVTASGVYIELKDLLQRGVVDEKSIDVSLSVSRHRAGVCLGPMGRSVTDTLAVQPRAVFLAYSGWNFRYRVPQPCVEEASRIIEQRLAPIRSVSRVYEEPPNPGFINWEPAPRASREALPRADSDFTKEKKVTWHLVFKWSMQGSKAKVNVSTRDRMASICTRWSFQHFNKSHSTLLRGYQHF